MILVQNTVSAATEETRQALLRKLTICANSCTARSLIKLYRLEIVERWNSLYLHRDYLLDKNHEETVFHVINNHISQSTD